MNDRAEQTPELTGPGTLLAKQREAKRLSVAEVAARLKFAPRQIVALEADCYDKLPGTTIVRGMIRNYARLLDIDSAPLLRAFEAHHVAAPVAVDVLDENIPFPDGRARSTRVYLALTVVVVATMAGVLYEWQFGLPAMLTASPQSAPKPQPVPAEVTRVASAPPSPVSDAPAPAAESIPAAPPAPSGDHMVFEFRGESWVEVKDRNGQTLLSQLNARGTRRVVEGEAPFQLIIGNATQVDLRYRDEPVDLKPHTRVEVARMKLE